MAKRISISFVYPPILPQLIIIPIGFYLTSFETLSLNESYSRNQLSQERKVCWMLWILLFKSPLIAPCKYRFILEWQQQMLKSNPKLSVLWWAIFGKSLLSLYLSSSEVQRQQWFARSKWSFLLTTEGNYRRCRAQSRGFLCCNVKLVALTDDVK